MQIVFVKKKKGCKNFMEKQTDSVETVKSIASDLKAVEPIVSVKNLIVTGKRWPTSCRSSFFAVKARRDAWSGWRIRFRKDTYIKKPDRTAS